MAYTTMQPIRTQTLKWSSLVTHGSNDVDPSTTIRTEFLRFCVEIDSWTPVMAAALGNDSGIVGAALAEEGCPTS